MYSLIADTGDASAAYDSFINIYSIALDLYFPTRKLRNSNRMTPRHVWMTKGLMKACIKKSRLYKIYRRESTIKNRDKYIFYRNNLKMLLRLAEKRYYSDKLMQVKGNMRQTWKVIGSVLNQNRLSLILESFQVDGADVTSTDIILEKFNEYFKNIRCNLTATIPNCPVSYKDYLSGQFHKNSLFLNPTNCVEVTDIVKHFESKTSEGVDGIPLHILKATINNIAEPLSRLINIVLFLLAFFLKI